MPVSVCRVFPGCTGEGGSNLQPEKQAGPGGCGLSLPSCCQPGLPFPCPPVSCILCPGCCIGLFHQDGSSLALLSADLQPVPPTSERPSQGSAGLQATLSTPPLPSHPGLLSLLLHFPDVSCQMLKCSLGPRVFTAF